MADDPSSSAPPLLHHPQSLLSKITSMRSLYRKKIKIWTRIDWCCTKAWHGWHTCCSGPFLSLCDHTILPLPTAAHSQSHASNAVPTPERTTTFEVKLSTPPIDTTALILKIPSPQAQRLWRQRRLPPKLSHHPSTQTFLTKTWCGAIYWTAIPLQEETLTFYQSPLLPHQQNQPNRTSHLAIPSSLRLSTSQPYMIISQRQRKRHPQPIPILTHKTPKT